jgi:hypothetical protein
VASPVSQKRTHGPQKRQSLGGADLEPLSRRALQAAGALSLLLILVVANSLLNSGGESPFDPNPVAAAAERTAEVPGMRIAMTMRMESESTPPVTVTGKGVYNGEDNLAEVTYDGIVVQGQRLKFDAVLGESAWYFRYPQLAGKMPEGKEWLKIEGSPGRRTSAHRGSPAPTNRCRYCALRGPSAASARRRSGACRSLATG